MFTTEIDHDEITIHVIDDTGHHEDFLVYIYDDLVYFKQWVEEDQRHVTLCISPDMYDEFTSALNLPAGAYIKRSGKNEST